MGQQRFLDKARQDIKRVGWTVVAVSGDADIHMPVWAYTIGVTQTHRHPELTMVGLAPETMQHILNNVGFLVRDGAMFSDGTHSNDVLQRYPVAFRTVHRSWYEALFGSARRFYKNWQFDMLHVIYPDAAGRFPWDDGCAPEIAIRQPRLDLPMPTPGLTKSV